MMRESLLLFACLTACDGASTTPAPHGHDHEPGQADHHEVKPAPEAAPDAGTDAAQAPSGGVEFAVGPHQGTLVAGPESLTLTIVDSAGAAMQPAGEAKVVLTGTGEQEQRVVLKADGAGWTGAAMAQGAPGYTAVVSVPVGAATESGKATWGTVPDAKPAHEHGEGHHDHEADNHDDEGHGHDHGAGGHDH